jgi:hypothetical protein
VAPDDTPGIPGAVPSPDGRWLATTECCVTGSVVDVEQQRTASLPMYLSAHLVGWTADSRFAIFGGRHSAKYFTFTYVFDVQVWDWILVTPGCTMHGGDIVYSDPCGEYPLALDPTASRFLMENGILFNLPGLEQVDLMPERRGDPPLIHFPMAGWSPDGASLAWVMLLFPRPGYSDILTTLYTAQGDGSEVEALVLGNQFPRSFEWAADSRTVTVAIGPERQANWAYHTVDIATGTETVTTTP